VLGAGDVRLSDRGASVVTTGESLDCQLSKDACLDGVASRRIAIIMYGYGLGNSPSLINAAEMLAIAGYEVDFFTRNTFLGNISFDNSRIRLHDLTNTDNAAVVKGGRWVLGGLIGRLKDLLWKILPPPLKVRIELQLSEKRNVTYAKAVSRAMGTTAYRCFIGVEPLGLMAASRLGVARSTSLIYYNMELHQGTKASSIYESVCMTVEKSHIMHASFTITQDANRARIIARETGVSEETFVLLPVCAKGEPFRKKTDDLRKLLNLRQTDKIILYAGFIADWAMCEEIATSARSWPRDWVLVFHTHGYSQQSYMQKLRKYEGETVRFSLKPVSYEELSGFLASADIGIALYRDLGANFTLIGSASGKIAHYLKSGIPVIVNSYPDICQIVERYPCGTSVGGPDDMEDAIATILENYETMHDGAYRCYLEHYEFSRYFGKVLEKIEQLKPASAR